MVTPRIKVGDTVGLAQGDVCYLYVPSINQWLVVSNTEDIALIMKLSGGIIGTYVVKGNNLLWIAGGVGVVLLLILFARKS